MRVRVLLAVAVLFSSAAVSLAPPPASAASVVVSGTQITVTSTADEQIAFSCQGGNVRVNSTLTSPTLACSALTKVTVTSINSTDQSVQGLGLNGSAFTAGPALTANLGGGDDVVTETDRADTINLGSGKDLLVLRMPTTPNTTLDVGADDDSVRLTTISGDDTASATSSNASLFLGIASTGGATSFTVLNAEGLRLDTLGGDDTLSSVGITAASTVDDVVLVGGDGDDTLTTGVGSVQLQGGAGTNEFNGGAADDVVITASETDDISLGSGNNRVLDTSSLRSGGRTVANGIGNDTWYLGQYPGDSVARIRSGNGGGTTKIVASLTRPGIQPLVGWGAVEVALENNTEPAAASLVDVIVSSADVTVGGSGDPKELLDITVPTGSWSASTSGTKTTFDLTAPGYGTIVSDDVAQVRIHGPWANTNQSYAHRVIRDLLFRFPTTPERDALANQLTAGTKTPATTVQGLMNSDEYRGLDVDRVFVKYLRRVADPGGRTYWINSLRNGKALWRFRAQLFGSSEYFTKAGGTNAAYVARAYNDVLGRNPDPSGQAYWTNKLNNGADRGQVALQFMNSPEARRRLVDDQYLRFIERLPTTSERDVWVPKIPTATGELDLIAALASSTSYDQFD